MKIKVHKSEIIPGLLIFELEKNEDSRGYFQEKYHRNSLVELGLPEKFSPAQHNISYNAQKGVTRGFHAEPWDKYISVISGKIFAAFVDLRPGSHGQKVTLNIDDKISVFLPQGVANSYQTLEDNVYYSYLVTTHWEPDIKYLAVNLADPDLAIAWPISLDKAIISDKDKKAPMLKEIK